MYIEEVTRLDILSENAKSSEIMQFQNMYQNLPNINYKTAEHVNRGNPQINLRLSGMTLFCVVNYSERLRIY